MSKRVVRNRRTQKIKLSSTPSLLSCLTSSKPSLVFSQALALALPALLLALVQVLVVLALVQALGEPQASILEWAQGQGKLVHTRIALVVCMPLALHKLAECTPLQVHCMRKLVERTPLQVHCMRKLVVRKSAVLHSCNLVLSKSSVSSKSSARHSFGKLGLRSFASHRSLEQQSHTRSRLEQCTKKLRSWSLVQLHKRRCRQRLE
mmetsp:Transcript_43922/g.69532  ORF Transcript_43922/g.69532 Transcript_43922/m.69532 type:complete len:206 (-) Transcript_43922:101-718(-)